MQFMKVLQHVPKKVLICIKITCEKKTTQKKKRQKALKGILERRQHEIGD